MILLEPERLVARLDDVRSLLLPLRGRQNLAVDFSPYSPPGVKSIVAHEGGTLDHWRNATFRTTTRNLLCSYFEQWKAVHNDAEFCLERAYLTVFEVDRVEHRNDEILCVHCDPEDDFLHKRGPHVHVVKADQPLPHAHFPLNLGHLQRILRSTRSITSAMRSAIGIVKREIIPLYPE